MNVEQQFHFTGNPFVDTGLSVLVARARESGWSGDALDELTAHALQQAIGDGTWLAQANRRLKAFSMVVGNNSPLTNTSSNPSLLKAHRGKFNPKDDKGFQEYVTMLRELVGEVTAPPQDNAQVCECCGMRPPTHVLAAHGKDSGATGSHWRGAWEAMRRPCQRGVVRHSSVPCVSWQCSSYRSV